MGNDSRVVNKEWLFLVFTDKFKHLLGNHLWCVIFTGQATGITFKRNLFTVTDKVFRIQIMSMTLAIIAKKAVESLVEWVAC